DSNSRVAGTGGRRRTLRLLMRGIGTALLALWLGAAGAHAQGGMTAGMTADVTQYHRDGARTGLFIEPEMTPARIAAMKPTPLWSAPVAGPVYAQPLVWTAPDGRRIVIVATEQDQVLAFDAANGERLWSRTLGTPAPPASLPCGDIDPLGITGTPVIDGGILYLDAMVRQAGAAPRHLIFALNASDGSVRPGWPVDVQAALAARGMRFVAANQGERGALAVDGGKIFVPYAGHFGDCAFYRGWVVGVTMRNPGRLGAWATRGQGGGIWAPGGIVSDGSSLYVATGNTIGADGRFGDGESVIRLGFGPNFPGRAADFFAPSNWQALDDADLDLGATNPTLAGPFVIALGKDGNAYLLDRNDLGGIGGARLVRQVSSFPIRTATATYGLNGARYVVFQGEGLGCPGGRAGDLIALRIAGGSPPSLSVAWCAEEHGLGAPIVTVAGPVQAAGGGVPIVWAVGAEGDERLRAFRGSDGAVLFISAPMGLVRRYTTLIAAGGRLYVGADRTLYAFGF
ncbi:MAG TPA: PQQ-binding-like beta-propeller repeat protein, partial [Acetobacteraceae bacterium]|nr:PQQ-binding-like beta-propeller repeat protein [Acetobacteraceae bacterium]